MIEYLPLVLTGLGLTASIVYYASVLRNQNETRQIQLLLEFLQGKIEKGNLAWFEVMTLEWEDYDDFIAKYSYENDPEIYQKRLSMWDKLNISGLLIQDGVIDVKTYVQYVGDTPPIVWEKFKDIIVEQRRRYNNPDHMVGLEYLAEAIDSYRVNNGLDPKLSIYNGKEITPLT